MTIIEVDGVSHKPLTVDSLQIFGVLAQYTVWWNTDELVILAGQRYSFVLNANQKVGNYWVRANPNLGFTGFAGGINSAILRYVGAPHAEPTTNSTPTNPLVETALHPLARSPVPGKPFPGGADVTLNLNIALNFTSFKFMINGAVSPCTYLLSILLTGSQTFVPPSAPVLLQILSGAQAAQNLLPAGSVYSLPPNKVIEVSIPGGAPGAPHPFHLHGVRTKQFTRPCTHKWLGRSTTSMWSVAPEMTATTLLTL
jgi:iron transport multicopper oxidase